MLQTSRKFNSEMEVNVKIHRNVASNGSTIFQGKINEESQKDELFSHFDNSRPRRNINRPNQSERIHVGDFCKQSISRLEKLSNG